MFSFWPTEAETIGIRSAGVKIRCAASRADPPRLTLNEKHDMLRVVKKQLSETRLHLGERDHVQSTAQP